MPGTVTRRDLLAGYADHLKKLVDISSIRPLTVAVDAGNGMAGHTVPEVFEGLPITLVPLYFALDGTFPNHEANPIEPENLRDLQRAVVEHHADIGLAFDGDADRCFVVDERGQIVSPSVLTALIAARELAREPGATIIHNLITSRAVPEIVCRRRHPGAHPGRPLVHQGRDGARPARCSAASTPGTSTSGTSGSPTPACSPRCTCWPPSASSRGRCPSCSPTTPGTSPAARSTARWRTRPPSTEQVRQAFAGRPGVSTDELDGLTVTAGTWWFNVRPSNTEPLLRLNVEADTEAAMAALRDEVLGVVRGTRAVPSSASPGATPGTPEGDSHAHR